MQLSEIVSKPFKIENVVKNYEWGDSTKNGIIQRLTNNRNEENKAFAELWIGAHVSGSSKLIVGNITHTLVDLIEKYSSEILGEKAIQKFGKKLPFLLKILSATKPLSIQVHPNKDDAKLLNKKFPDNYPDDSAKPEIAIVLDNLKMVSGFKNKSQIKQTIEQYVSLKQIFSASTDYNHLNILEEILLLNQDVNKIKTLTDNLAIEISNTENKTFIEHSYLKLYKEHGNDIGLLFLLFMNYYDLDENEAVYTEAGVIHAYLEGNIIECMANSDNVVRAGLTKKLVDLENLEFITKIKEQPEFKNNHFNNCSEYSIPSNEFKVQIFNSDKDEQIKIKKNNIDILFVLKGSSNINTIITQTHLRLLYGESAIVPAIINEYELDITKGSRIIRATIP